MSDASGIYWTGPIYDRSGYGNVSRNYIRALLAARIPVRVLNLGGIDSDIDPEAARAVRACEESRVGDRPIGVVHYLPHILESLRLRGVAATVSASIFETHSIPAQWVRPLNRMDQVWVPSRFNESSYGAAGIRREKLRVIPYAVDCAYYHPMPRTTIPGARGFVFLFVFAFDWRKGFDLLLRAYVSEFAAGEDVTLVLKVSPGFPAVPDLAGEILRSGLAACEQPAGGWPPIVILTEPMSQSDLRSLYAGCDVCISTDRANGWGMPCQEAMAMGKAAAAVNWSGSTEFMNEDNAFLIRPTGELEAVDPRLVEARGDLYQGQKWARVEASEVRRVLREAFENRSLVREKGERGAATVRENFSLERIGETIRGVLGTFSRLRSTWQAPAAYLTEGWRRDLGRDLRECLGFRLRRSGLRCGG